MVYQSRDTWLSTSVIFPGRLTVSDLCYRGLAHTQDPQIEDSRFAADCRVLRDQIKSSDVAYPRVHQLGKVKEEGLGFFKRSSIVLARCEM